MVSASAVSYRVYRLVEYYWLGVARGRLIQVYNEYLYCTFRYTHSQYLNSHINIHLPGNHNTRP